MLAGVDGPHHLVRARLDLVDGLPGPARVDIAVAPEPAPELREALQHQAVGPAEALG